MPILNVNGIRLHYQVHGSGDPVVLLMGSGSTAQSWRMHQVPALNAAGFQAVLVDNRGIPPTDECSSGFTIEDMLGDVIGLIESLGIGPARIIGTSMGAYLAQELCLARPGLVRQAVLMASRARSDAARAALARGERELAESGVAVPSGYAAIVRALQMLSPSSLDDERSIVDWLDLFELGNGATKQGLLAQLKLEPMPDRRDAYRHIAVPCHVISFADDLITPPRAGRELAALIPGSSFELVPEAGHYGYLESPEMVNKSIIEFFHSS
ncbi:alpha/beta fold hydrolase [Sciscionella sediminilitoris]|uniref:alpha/beta fold hydrolase n=1 Tax=Sciscionella sediminilitoris TaxID=1445613 RepID=UPI0004DEE4E1|nr:alpha/beta hydrolase [Sciscionella sp. SE31]